MLLLRWWRRLGRWWHRWGWWWWGWHRWWCWWRWCTTGKGPGRVVQHWVGRDEMVRHCGGGAGDRGWGSVRNSSEPTRFYIRSQCGKCSGMWEEEGAWYVSNVSIIFDAPCLFLHHLPCVSLHFVAFLCDFQN
jgi:hypothetical protein